MKILLIEDEVSTAEAIKNGLEKACPYTVDVANTGETGFDMAGNRHYSLIILDLNAADMDGCALCEKLRDHRINAPVLLLNQHDTPRDRVRGLELGADDCLSKPFDFDEFLARVRALIRRDNLFKGRVIRIANLEIDTTARRVYSNGGEVQLTSREYTLLEALAANEGRILSRDAIQYRVWNNEDKLSNTVDVYIRMLRRKVDTGRPVKLIHTVHGLGYMLKRPS